MLRAALSAHYQKITLALAVMTLPACVPVGAQQKPEASTPMPTATVAAPAPYRFEVRPVPAGLPPSPDTPARRAVLAAHDALSAPAGKGQQLASLAAQAKGDPLQIYVDYWALRSLLGRPGGRQVGDVDHFIEQYQGSYLADRLRVDMLLASARSGSFYDVVDMGEPRTGGPQVACARLLAEHMTSGRPATAQQALAVFKPNAMCWKLFDQLVADKVLGWNELLPLMRDAVEANRPDDVERFGAYLLEPGDRKSLSYLLKEPMKWLVRGEKPVIGRNEKALATIALARLARSDLDVADSYLRRIWEKSLTKPDLAWVRSEYALAAAMAQDSRAQAWFKEAGSDVRLTPLGHAWRVRVALREKPIDWRWVLASIGQMDADQQAEPAWTYWKARALSAQGQADAARRAYESIAGGFGFYGQLAAEELGRPLTLPPMSAPVTDAEMAEARANPGLVRAVQLFRLGWRPEALQEWNYTLRDMSDRQLLAAAELARAENLYDRVVNTSDRTQSEFDFTQRYIAPFADKMNAKAQANGLEPAWVYGLIRQESRFVIDARSYVGAAGLMQVMPATAKYVAKKIGMTDYNPAQIHDFDVNTELGTQYLNMVQEELEGSQLMASAGYNAGPGRPRKWSASFDHPVEGAIFAETIPFNETRDYVQNVMANATWYAALFTGQPQSLKARLGQIAPDTAAIDPDLP